MTDSSGSTGVPPSIDRILRRFATLSPDLTRQALVQYANRLPPLPEHLRALDPEQHRVHECMTPVSLFPEVVDGKMYFHADLPRESATLRALLAMLFEALNGQPPEVTLAIPPDFVRRVMGGLGLQVREAGLVAMVERLKRAARQALETHPAAASG